MQLRLCFASLVIAVVTIVAGCGGTDVKCGDGTTLSKGHCVIADGGAVISENPPDSGHAVPVSTAPKCGKGTEAVKGECVPVDAGPPAPEKQAVGSACTTNDECRTGFCAPAAGNLPGGYCTILNCDMKNPCPVGSTCYAINKTLSICMAYCDREVECRTSEDYHCQPLYTTALNICAPSCVLTGMCDAGTRCNTKTGLCDLAECDTANPGSACTDQETCWPDAKGISTAGGLCLHLCDPAHPEKACLVDKREVCQPLEDDPANSGFCAPPVCSKTEECPAGATCSNSVCQPPALCDSNNACADNTTTCVSGKCMPKCPTGSAKCSDMHSGLVCADVLAVPACLPLGSFPGGDCRVSTHPCDGVTTNHHKADMVCASGKCLPDCGADGQALCTELSDTLICAAGIFPQSLCLPKGSFPGGPCGASDACAQGLNGNSAVNMSCVRGTCAITCSETNAWSGYGDALCKIVDPSLTCATAAGGFCARACSDTGTCSTGFSCLDPGAVPAHENACLPDGSFPGSPCRAISGDECDQDLGGDTSKDMVCAAGKCVVSCPSNNDSLCQSVDPRLTCAESAGNICVFACGSSGGCPTDFSCIDKGGSGHQNACLPTGSFPGSPCRAGSDKCDQDLKGDANADMVCVGSSCVVSCAAGGEATCTGVSPVLTCSESASNLCVLSCLSTACPTGYSCLDQGDSTHQNECLPTGSFPGSPCRTDANNKCDAHLGGGSTGPTMTCTSSNVCVVQCPGGGTDGDTLCSGVSAALTCSDAAGQLCVRKCDAIYDSTTLCPSDFSCLAATGENTCLPTGTFPGSPCRSDVNDKCDAHLGGGSTGPTMACTSTNVCVVQCPNNDDTLCAGVDGTLTCSESAGNICVPKCDSNGGCMTGYSCLDRGAENACLPNGSFPGLPCGGTNSDQCAQDLNGNSAVDMTCTRQGTCAVMCPANKAQGDAFCAGLSNGLTCSESAGNICVYACGTNGACPTDYSCLDPGDTTHQNACLPTGSFPGSACRSTTNDECDQNVGGNAGVDMVCKSGTCLVQCSGSAGDTLCSAVNAALTCSDAAGGVCLPACNVAYGTTKCPPGLSCLGTTNENACLPNGSFLGSACAGGTTCSGPPMLVCVPSATPVCAAGCDLTPGQAQADAYCANVGTAVGTGYTTCTTLSSTLHICTGP